MARLTGWNVHWHSATRTHGAYALVILHGREPKLFFRYRVVGSHIKVPIAPDQRRDKKGCQEVVGVWGVTEQKVVISLPDGLPPHLTGTKHDWQMRGFFHIRSCWSKRKSERKGHLEPVKQAHEQAYYHFLFRYSPNADHACAGQDEQISR